MIGQAELENRFSYHKPTSWQAERYVSIRKRALDFADYLNAHCPSGQEKFTAIRKLEECVMWANAAIARRERHTVGKEETTKKAPQIGQA